MKIFTKESLIAALTAICNGPWVQSCKPPGNDGAVGNTLEQLLGIQENNRHHPVCCVLVELSQEGNLRE